MYNKELRQAQKGQYFTSGSQTIIGMTSSKKKIATSDDMRHMFICGTTGSGKTVVLSNYIKSAIDNGYGTFILDGKGDVKKDSILDITRILTAAGANKRVYVIDLTDPDHSDKFNPFQNGNISSYRDMLINMTDWSEEHYKLNTERYLQRVLQVLSKYNVRLTFETIVKAISPDKFISASMELQKTGVITKAEHQANVELAKVSGKIAESAAARFSTLLESEIGQIFHPDGIDIYSALQENAIILFVLNPLLYPEMSPLMGRLALIDSKKAVTRLFGDERRKFFIFDEISSFASLSLLDLVNKSRSANVTCLLSTQSLSDLDTVSEHFKEQIIENCNNYLVLRQNSPTNAEIWANVLGTRSTLDVTYQLQQKGLNTAETGFGSARRVREFLYHPDDIKTLTLGRGIYLSKDNNFHARVLLNKPF